MSQLIDSKAWNDFLPWIDRPDADIGQYIRQLPASERDFAEHYLTAWQRDGVVVFEKAVPPQLIDALLSDVDYLVRHHKDFELAVEVQGQQLPKISEVSQEDLRKPGTKFNSIHQISRAAVGISLNKTVMRFMRHVFQDAPTVLQSLTFFRGSQQPVHLDYPYVRTQTKIAHLTASWTALEDISPDAGALAYWPGAHRTGLIDLFDWGQGSIVLEPDSIRNPVEFSEYLQAKLEKTGIPKKAFTPRRGDVLVWHALMPHEGTAIRNPDLTRKSYVTHFTSKGAYPGYFMKPNALAEGHYTESNGGYYFTYGWLNDPKQLPSRLDGSPAGSPAFAEAGS